MKKTIVIFIICLISSLKIYSATPPETLLMKGTALSESTEPVSMYLNGNVYELFTSLKSGTYSFQGDNNIQEQSLTVTEGIAPYCIRVDYSATNPAVTLKKIEKVYLFIPWTNHDSFTLTYTGNSVFAASDITCSKEDFGYAASDDFRDSRYRIRIKMEGGQLETYAPKGDSDFALIGNGTWGAENDFNYVMPSKYRGTGVEFNLKVILQPGYYTHLLDETNRQFMYTSWGENIDPDNLFNEYPRPQMQRGEWVNLNGYWALAKRNTKNIGTYNPAENYDRQILVPFPIESALSGIADMDYNSKNKSYAYKKNFTVPAGMNGKQILLHFGGVDWQTVVFVNGTEVGHHKGGFDPFYFDITSALNGSGEQELVVQVYDPTNGGQPRGKQAVAPGGIFYTPASGIWQTVWFEAVHSTHINDFTIVPDIDNNSVNITVEALNADAGTTVDITVLDGETQVAKHTAVIGSNKVITIPAPKLWSPKTPFLYNLKFELKKGGVVVDNVDSYFGMRKISKGMLRGKPFLYLNNEPVFHYGPLDQGYWPDGLMTAPGYDALRYDLEITKELGFNMTRKHIKTEPARWYYYCDSIGLMVWQDMVNPSDYTNNPGSLGDTDWMKSNFLRESENIVKSLKNYPSIVMWVAYNEDWGQLGSSIDHTRDGVNLIRSLDTTRLVNAVSGWIDYEIGDIIDKHSYSEPSLHDNPVNERISVCGETGGYGLAIEGHLWNKADNPYTSARDSEHLTELLEKLNNITFNYTPAGISGLVYTQITDVEDEVNGLYTYDRKVSKLNEVQKARFKAGIEKMQQYAVNVILPAGVHVSNSMWKYTTGNETYTLPTGWNNDLNYDDSTWQEGAAGFGAGNPPEGVNRTEWKNETIYLRKKIVIEQLTEEEIQDLKLLIFHDEDYQVYINGVLASSETRYSTSYITKEISEEAKNAIRFGQENLIAVKCIQTTGGQGIDVGIVYDIALSYDGGQGTGIREPELQTVANNLKISRKGKDLQFSVTDPASLWLYDMTGRLVKHFYVATSATVSLQQGVYVARSMVGNTVEYVKFLN